MEAQPTVSGISGRGLSKSFSSSAQNRLDVISNLSLTVEPGEFVAIIGPSGCGKTTLLKILGGLSDPDQGTILIGGLKPRHALSKKAIGYVFQDPTLLPWRTVLQNIHLPLEVNVSTNGHGTDPEEIMDSVGLGAFEAYYPHQLSGGMRQRVALARAFAFQPSVLLMDEPFGMLDEITRESMRYELLALWETTGKTVVFVTHSVAEATLLADRVLVMSGSPGRLSAEIKVDFPRPRNQAIERSARFLELTSSVRKALSSGSSDLVIAGSGKRKPVTSSES